MGWVLLALIGVASVLMLALLGVPRRLWTVVGAAMMLAAAGYAAQGKPTLAGSAAKPATDPVAIQPEVIDLRILLFGRFGSDAPYLAAADALVRSGAPRLAAKAALGGLVQNPKSAALWTELGSTLAVNDGIVSPPSLFAFQQAMRLEPGHPGPPFFLGLAYLDQGDFRQARTWWARSLALTPAQAAYHDQIAGRLALLDAVIGRIESGNSGR